MPSKITSVLAGPECLFIVEHNHKSLDDKAAANKQTKYQADRGRAPDYRYTTSTVGVSATAWSSILKLRSEGW